MPIMSKRARALQVARGMQTTLASVLGSQTGAFACHMCRHFGSRDAPRRCIFMRTGELPHSGRCDEYDEQPEEIVQQWLGEMAEARLNAQSSQEAA